jgi:aminomethyltransferase
MKRTPLFDTHVKLGARIVEFAGYEMPVQYTSILEEHEAVRTKAGIFDVSHMGEFIVKGKNAEKYIASLIPTSTGKFEAGKGVYSCLCNESGTVIDDLFIFMNNRENFYLVVNAGTMEKDFAWMKSHLIDEVDLVNISDSTAKIDVQGPESKKIISEIFKSNKLENLPRFYFYYDSFEGIEVMISNTGYTGEAGYELFINNESAEALWNTIIDKGTSYGLKPAGLGCRDTLRLEACYSLYGHEINEEINPVEAGLSWLINSESDYIGKKILSELKEKGAARKQVCIEIEGRGIPRENCEVHFNDQKIGYVTSGAFSPTFKKGVALALVKKESASIGDNVDVIIRDKPVKGVIVKRPFYGFNG